MAIGSLEYPKPDNEVFFETLCLKVFRIYRNLPHLEKFARRGQRQFGVDLVSTAFGQLVGIQCKLRNTASGLTLEEVNDAIELAKTFVPPLHEFIIATTADRDPELQAHAIRVTQDHHKIGLFEVVVYGWQDIGEILKQHPELALDLHPAPPAALAVVSAAAASYQIPPGTFHAEIDEAARNITEDKPDVALALLEKLRRERWDNLSPREKFRVIANLGNALFVKGDSERAALRFLESAQYQPQDDDAALSVAAHGYLLQGDIEQAYRMSSEACARNPQNERAHMVRLQSAPKEVSYRDLFDSVPEVLRSDSNIALLLHERALEENDPIEAERAIRQVKEESPILHAALGAALLQQGLPAGVQEAMLLLPRDKNRVREAYEHLTKAIESSNAPDHVVTSSYFNRATASSLLGDENQAFLDVRRAYEREPSNEIFGLAFTIEALRRGDVSGACQAAEELFNNSPTPEHRLLLSKALYETGLEDERARSLKVLQGGLGDIESAASAFRLEYMLTILRFLQDSGAVTEEAAETLTRKLKDPLERGVINSWALLRMGRQDEAKAEANNIIPLLDDVSEFLVKREVAMLLSRVGMEEQALPVWLEICSPRGFTEDTMRLLQVAKRLGRDDEILDYCEQLRLSGIYAPEAAEVEVEALIRYNELSRARDAIKEYLDANPNHLSLGLFLLHIAALRGWSDLVDHYMSSFPSSEDIQTDVQGVQLVQILYFKKMNQTAVETAYQLVRRFPDSPHSHRALIVSILGPGSSRGDLHLGSPQEVTVGSAVRIRKPGEESSEWVVIEDSANPEVSREEYAPDHPLAKALIGKKVDESITLPGYIRSQTAVVEEIKNKILHRMHQSMEVMNRRFPEHSFFDSIPLRIQDDSSEIGQGLEELVEFSRQLAKGPMEADELYRERRLPVAMLSRIVDREIPEVVESLARDDRSAIHCVGGTAEEFERVKGILGSAHTMVLDLTALSTVGLLENEFDLSRMVANCIVSEGTLGCLKRLGRSVAEDERVGGYLGFDGERPVYREIVPEVEHERASRAMAFAQKIESLCEVVGGRALARMEPSPRNMMVKILGQETAEAVAIAKERNMPLWTDDYVTGALVQNELSLQRIWTQSLCFWLRDAGAISAEECDTITSRLCAFNYRYTSISGRVVIVACRLSSWDPSRQPLNGVLDRLDEQGRENNMLVLAASLIPIVWREAPSHDHSSRVTTQILEKISRGKKGMAIIQAILSRLDALFGVNVIGAERARVVIEAWLSVATKSKIII